MTHAVKNLLVSDCARTKPAEQVFELHRLQLASMMLAGCFGLLRAYAANYPEAADQIEQALAA